MLSDAKASACETAEALQDVFQQAEQAEMMLHSQAESFQCSVYTLSQLIESEKLNVIHLLKVL